MGEIEKTEQFLIPITFCRNCNNPLQPVQKFCDTCGAKRITKRLTFRNLIEDFTSNLFNVDNTFIRTFIDLFTKPEDVIVGYISGVRKKYIPAFGYFAISITLAGLYIFLFNNFFSEEYMAIIPTVEGKEGDAKRIMEFVESANKYNGLTSFLLIPIASGVSRLVFWNYKRFNYVEHMVIFLYALSHFNMVNYLVSSVLIWSATLGVLMSFASIALYLLYVAYVFKRIYSLSFGKIVLKTLLFLGIGFIILILIIVVFVVLLSVCL